MWNVVLRTSRIRITIRPIRVPTTGLPDLREIERRCVPPAISCHMLGGLATSDKVYAATICRRRLATRFSDERSVATVVVAARQYAHACEAAAASLRY